MRDDDIKFVPNTTMEYAFGKDWRGKRPSVLILQMLAWCDQNGDHGPVVSVSKDVLANLAVYIEETCDWKGAAFYALR